MKRRRVDSKSYVEDVAREVEAEATQKRRKKKILTNVEYEINKAGETSIEKSYALMDKIFDTLLQFDKPPTTRYLLQIRLHRILVSRLAALIFKKNFVSEKLNIMKRYQYASLDTLAVVQMPRRFGKSVGFGMLLAVALMCIPNCKIGIVAFSKASAATDGLLGIIKGYVKQLRGDHSATKITVDNENHLSVTFSNDDTRRVLAFSTAQSLRGQGFDILVVEEAAFVKDSVYEVVLPMMTRSDVAMFVFSSPATDENLGGFFNRIIQKGGQNVFVIETVCASCKVLGKEGPCIHRKSEVPEHTSKERGAFVASLYGDEQKAQYEREMMGQSGGMVDSRFFKPHLLEHLFKRPRVALQGVYDRIIVAVDPCGGSANLETSISDFAVCVTAYGGGTHTVVAMEAFPITHPRDYRERLVGTLIKVRNLPLLQRTKMIICVEQGTGGEAGSISELVQERVSDVEIFRSAKKEGMSTTHSSKLAMITNLQTRLNERSLCFCDKIISTGNADELVFQLSTQLARFREWRTVPTSPHIMPKVTFGGKGENGTLKDDQAMALMINLYCGALVMSA